MNIITGYKNEAHVTSQQDRDINIGIFGSGVYIANIGNKLAATVVSANEVSIADGLLIADGCAAEVARGTSESMTIANGSQGMLRKDLIVARYTKTAGTGVENMALAVITGTPAASSPAVPSYTSGSIAAGDTTVEFPLYTVNLDGISIDSVTAMVSQVELSKKSVVDSLTTTVNSLVTKIGNVAMGTVATTVTGAIKELLTKINANTSNVADARTRVSALETKTDGFVRVTAYNVSAGANDYKQMNNLATYVLIVNAASTLNTMQGMYLIGSTTNGALGIKAISAASSVTVTDGGDGLLKVTNNGSSTLRCTLIRTYG